MNLDYLKNANVYQLHNGETIAKLKIPSDEVGNSCEIFLTAEQIVSAKIEPHGNFGRSKVTFTLSVQVQAIGTVEEHREYFARCLLDKINRQTEIIDSTAKKLREVSASKELLEADLRAKSVVESALLAVSQTK
jgi:hypothetical protein